MIRKINTKKENLINYHLIMGNTVKRTADITGFSYNKVAYFKRKLLTNGINLPVAKEGTTRHLRTNRKKGSLETKNLRNTTVLKRKTNSSVYEFQVNGIPVFIEKASSVTLTKNCIDIKY